MSPLWISLSRLPQTTWHFHSALSDPLLRDAVTELLVPMHAPGIVDVNAGEFQNAVARWVAEGKTTTKWSDDTTCRASQGLLSTLRDFGVLQGAVNKRIAPAHLPIDAFAYLAFYLKQQQPSAAKLNEFGARWHVSSWSPHTILDKNPLGAKKARRRGGFDELSAGPEEWTWAEPEPADLKPQVLEDGDAITVTFFTFSGLGRVTIFRHMDRFRRGSYCFTTERSRIATGPGGFVF